MFLKEWSLRVLLLSCWGIFPGCLTNVTADNPLGIANHLSITGPASIGANFCGTFNVQRIDPNGKSVPANGLPVIIILQTNSNTGAFYSNNSCTTKQNSAIIKASTSGADFYYMDTAASATGTDGGVVPATLTAMGGDATFKAGKQPILITP